MLFLKDKTTLTILWSNNLKKKVEKVWEMSLKYHFSNVKLPKLPTEITPHRKGWTLKHKGRREIMGTKCNSSLDTT